MFGTDNMHIRNLIPDVMLMQWGEEKCNVISMPRQINSKLGRMVATECKHGFSKVELEHIFQTGRQIAGSLQTICKQKQRDIMYTRIHLIM